jgi:2-dehydrotetronate isomerase
MPRYCANITLLFNEYSLLDRVDAAHEAGFAAVEVLFPYDCAASDLLERLVRNRMSLVLINCPPPNYTGGPSGFAAIPGGEARFRHDFRRSARYATALGAHHLHVMAGVAEGAAARDTFVENLRWAAAEVPGQSLTIEPINPFDMPGYFLDAYDLAVEVLAEVDAPNLSLQFDAYHAHRLTGDVMAAWEAVRHLVRHVQVAGHPGRHEPQGGEIDYHAFLTRLDSEGYSGWVSGEYYPAGNTVAGLGWRI